MIRILLVDDSEVIRFLLTKSLERDPDLKVVAVANNGIEAIELAKQHKPDVILLDIEMPQMDGLTALPKILQASPQSQVIVVTGGSRDGAAAAIESLGKGAREFILKPGAEGAAKAQDFNEDVRLKIKAIMGGKSQPDAKPTPLPTAYPAPIYSAAPVTTKPPSALETLRKMAREEKSSAPTTATTAATAATVATVATPTPATVDAASDKKKQAAVTAVVIASSTGGPEALIQIFKRLHGQLTHLPIFITQHMPPVFTAALAEHISRHGNRPCKEAVDGENPVAGITYIAPGGYHLILQKVGTRVVLRLTQDPPINSCRPAADPMFASASAAYRDGLLSVVLTGIGQDGLNGARTVVENGGALIAQSKETCVVYGMPRAVAEAGICDVVLPLEAIAQELVQRCSAT
jgi:two-component system chemotaxis response regulator CheB